jgi:hypothetical protein
MVEFHSGAARRDPACPIQAQNRPERYKSLRYAAYRAPNSRIISESSYGPLAAPLKTSNQLDATEGIPWSWYRPLWLDAEDINGHPFRAMTYIAHGKEVYSRPSLRYITLLREGARWRSRPSGYALGLRAHVNCGGGADGHIPIYLAGREQLVAGFDESWRGLP